MANNIKKHCINISRNKKKLFLKKNREDLKRNTKCLSPEKWRDLIHKIVDVQQR